MSPGMKAKIKSGQYTFPSPEWDCVSEAGTLFTSTSLVKLSFVLLDFSILLLLIPNDTAVF